MKKAGTVHVGHGQKNTLYTGRGDDGTTTLFHCNQARISKSADIIEALGSLDELNAYLGIVKVHSKLDQLKIKVGNPPAGEAGKKILYEDIINNIQQTLFIIQAQVAGFDMKVGNREVSRLEKIIHDIGEIIPPITAFTISGGSLLSAHFDYSRTLARNTERRIVAVMEEGIRIISPSTISYLNRLSSVLFALSRHANFLLFIKEEHPDYKKITY